MGKLNIQLCPETGICSLVKEDNTKVDLMPGEVDQLRDASGDAAKIKEVISQVDGSFSEALEGDELDQVSNVLK